VKYWEIIADNLKKAGWSYGYVSAVDSCGRTIFVADAHRDGKRFVIELESPTPYSVALAGQRARWTKPILTIAAAEGWLSVSHSFQVGADRKQQLKHIARIQEIEEDALSIERRFDLENRALGSFWPHIAVVGGELFQLAGI
jgi:hypothetical protein